MFGIRANKYLAAAFISLCCLLGYLGDGSEVAQQEFTRQQK